MKKYIIQTAVISIAFVTLLSLTSCSKQKKTVVKVGLLHSLTGTMSISETGVRDAELLAIKELNDAGGVLGCQIKVIEEDGKATPAYLQKKLESFLKKIRLPLFSAAGLLIPVRL